MSCLFVTKLVIYKTCSPVMYQLRVRIACFNNNNVCYVLAIMHPTTVDFQIDMPVYLIVVSGICSNFNFNNKASLL